MSKIRAKIIGNQIWTVENLTKDQYFLITGIKVPVKNKNWLSYSKIKCYKYNSIHESNKDGFLFNLYSAETLNNNGINNNTWRIPSYADLDVLFKNIDGKSSTNYYYKEVAINLRGNYGWPLNGTNKIGFNAMPNPTLNEKLELSESEISRWWIYNQKNKDFDGFGIYTEDIIGFSGTNNQMALAIRLVMDLTNPRVDDKIYYV